MPARRMVYSACSYFKRKMGEVLAHFESCNPLLAQIVAQFAPNGWVP